MSFIDLSSLGYASSASDLLALWQTYMEAAYPGYVPSQANLEFIDAQATSAAMSDVAQAGVVVPSAIFRAFGTKLANVIYQQGLAAIAVVTVTAVDTAGYTLPAGTSVTLGSFGFQTFADLTIPNGSSSGTVTVVASATGVAYNGAGNPAELQSVVNWVSSITAVAPASGGVDPEDDTDYQNRLAGQLRLQAPRPITAGDFATMAMSFAPTVGTDQQLIGRATSIDGYVKGAATFTVTTVSTSPTLTVTGSPGALITAAAGATITGAGIPANTLVQSSTTGTITMTANATASAAGVTATVGGTLGNEKTVTTCVTLADGTATNADTKTALAAWLQSLREINFVPLVIDPTYTTVYVSCSAHLYAGFDPTATQNAVQAALVAYLSPVNWRLPPFGDAAQWLNSTVVRINRLIAVVENVQGVDYVPPGGLTLGTSASPVGTTDLTLPGPCALPQSTTVSIPVPTIV